MQVKTLACGICSTDIHRAQLPFPLPQITGHEVIGLYEDQYVAIDINASHRLTGAAGECEYCQGNLANHCPQRLTLGIDRLPGGFAPYILVPQFAIITLPKNLSLKVASVVEPFAAALHAVTSENIRPGDSIAIIGPRKLGALLIFALHLWRKKNKCDFSLTSVIRNTNLAALVLAAGSDGWIDSENVTDNSFDIVYDTSGSLDGLQLAMRAAKRTVHLKSTNGQTAFGINVLTQIVIDEISLLPLKICEADANNRIVLIDDSLPKTMKNNICCMRPNSQIVYGDLLTVEGKEIALSSKFDEVFTGSLALVNKVVRNENGVSRIKPRGAIWIDDEHELQGTDLGIFFRNGKAIHTSRCGNFNKALEMLDDSSSESEQFIEEFITDEFSSKNFAGAFEKAKEDKAAIKVLVNFKEEN